MEQSVTHRTFETRPAPRSKYCRYVKFPLYRVAMITRCQRYSVAGKILESRNEQCFDDSKWVTLTRFTLVRTPCMLANSRIGRGTCFFRVPNHYTLHRALLAVQTHPAIFYIISRST
jgi:hypothetical protein